jgi:DNA-directed RNA polymerase specialized sigma24 family protein
VVAGDGIGAEVRILAVGLERRVDDLVEEMLERLLAEPDLKRYDQPHFRALARRIARENLLHEIHALKHDRRLPESCPPEAAMAARQAAELDSPVTVVLQCYRAGHAVLWSAWLKQVELLDASSDRRKWLLEVGSEFMFAYVERCTGFVIDEYARASDEIADSRHYQRLKAVRRVLAGASTDESALDYPLAVHHLGFVAWGPKAAMVLRRLSGRIGDYSLTIPGDDATVWSWAGVHAPLDKRIHRIVAQTDVPSGTALACGTPAHGADGFRQTHREAQDARAVAIPRTAPITCFADVAIEALALAAEPRAHALVARELGQLGHGDSRSERLLTTLDAYFAAGQNATAAAAHLGVNERTVRNRLQRIEASLGYAPTTRRVELETAIRFARVLRHAQNTSAPRPG